MTRTPIIAGNWKMNKTPAEGVDFVKTLLPKLAPYENVERVVCPAFVALPGVAEALKGSPIKVGAQNVHEKEKGAYTGSISIGMLKGLVEYVIIGHSEVRQYLHETDAMVNAKAKALLAAGIKPIIAVGESLQIRESGKALEFVSAQVKAAFEGIPAADLAEIVVAYEPIWAIGTGKVATAADANEVCSKAVREVLVSLYGADNAALVRIQYGGSVAPDNLRGFMDYADIDGALVGGASLEVEKFTDLIRIASESRK